MAVKILPSLPPNAFTNLLPHFAIQCGETSIEELIKLSLSDKLQIYIRHKPTLDLLAKYITNYETTTSEAKIENYEMFYVISLKTRAPSGQDVEVSEKDLLVLRCIAVRGVWI